MSFFSTRRERRLWLWTLAVVVAIYSTLGLARKLSDLLGDTGLGAGFFILGCLLVVATVVTQGLKTRPSGTEIVVALGVLTSYLLVFVRMAIPTERSHMIEYGVVDECIQAFLPNRVFDPTDMLFNTLAAVMAIVASAALAWARRRRARTRAE